MRRLLAALAAIASTTVLTACERAEFVQLEGNHVALTVRDYRYDRQNLRIRPGRTLFGVANEGPGPTNFRVRRGERDVLNITTMEPGERGVGYARLQPGEYVMYSSVGRNETLGERGTLVVSRRLASPPPEPRTGTRPGLTRP